MATEQQEEKKEELKLDANELEQDIKEAETEAAAERVAGNDARADKLEASIAETRKELTEIKDLIKGMSDRPFAPAPGDGEPAPDAQGRTGDGAAEKDAAPEGDGQGDEKKPKKKHWLYGDRWNQE